MVDDRPTPGLARLALATFLDQALGARLQEIQRDREARLEAFHDYLLLIRHVRAMKDGDGRLEALAMTALDSQTATLRLHSDRPLAKAVTYRAERAGQQADSFVDELVSILVADDLGEPDIDEEVR